MVAPDLPPTAGSYDRWLLDTVAGNHRVWFRRCAAAAGAGSVRLGGDELFLGPEAMIFPGPDLDVDALVAAIQAEQPPGAGVWSLSADPWLGTRLLARGFGWGWMPHWMAIDLEAHPPEEEEEHEEPAFVIEPAKAPYARTLPYAPNGPGPPESVHLGVRLREKMIGHVTINPSGEVAGLYAMGVVPKVRRRGIGMALVRAALRAARAAGGRHVVLNATPDGEALYRRAGFRSLGWGQTWWCEALPTPTQRQIELAEAIGFGDLSALEDLRPSVVELRDRLPGGEHPLELAVLTDQVQAADYLLERAPDLLSQRFGPHGTPMLHRAVELDRMAFVELALARGADLTSRDDSFGGTPVGWAEHFDRHDILARLIQAGAPPST